MAREETQGQNPGKGQCLRMCRGRDKEKQWGRWDVARCQGRGAHRREGLGGRACGGSCFHCQQGGLGGQGGAGRPRELGEDTAFLSRERVAWSFSVKMRVPARRGKDLDVVMRPPLVCSDWCVGCWAAVTLEARHPHPQQLPSSWPLHRRGTYLWACGNGDWLLGTVHRVGQKTRNSTLNLLTLLLGLPGSRGNEAGLLGEGDRNTAMAKRPCIDTEAG